MFWKRQNTIHRYYAAVAIAAQIGHPSAKIALWGVDIPLVQNLIKKYAPKFNEYEPQIISKYSRNADGIEEKILALYACGMSQRDISETIPPLCKKLGG